MIKSLFSKYNRLISGVIGGLVAFGLTVFLTTNRYNGSSDGYPLLVLDMNDENRLINSMQSQQELMDRYALNDRGEKFAKTDLSKNILSSIYSKEYFMYQTNGIAYFSVVVDDELNRFLYYDRAKAPNRVLPSLLIKNHDHFVKFEYDEDSCILLIQTTGDGGAKWTKNPANVPDEVYKIIEQGRDFSK